MGKHKQSSQTHRLYLGAGGMLAVAALVVSLTFGLSSAQEPSAGSFMPPPTDGGSYTHPPTDGGSYTTTPTGTTPYTTTTPTTPTGTTQYTHPPTDGGSYTTTPTGTTQYTPPPTGTTLTPPTGTQTQMPVCAAGQMPTAAVPCLMQGTPSTGTTLTPPIGTQTQMPVCTAGQVPTAAVPCLTQSTSPTGTQTQMPVCAAGQMPTAAVPCLIQGIQQPGAQLPGIDTTNMNQQPQQVNTRTFWCNSLGRMATGPECDAEDANQGRNMGPVMLECPDPYVAGGKTYRPDTIWDWQTQTDKQMTCALWAEQDRAVPAPAATGMFPGMQGNMFPGMQGANMQFPGMPGMSTQFPGQNQPDNTTMQQGPRGMFEVDFQDKCKYNPNDPFCKGGFVQDYSEQYGFSEEDLAKYEKELSQGQVRQEIQSLRRELQHIKQNGREAKMRVAEVQRECNGLAVPIFAEVDAIGDQFNALASDIENLPKDATPEQVQQLSARVGASVRLDKALYGEGPGKFGKMQGLDVGREICWINHRWNEEVQRISRDIADAEKAGIDVAAAKVVLEKLKAGAANPLKGMTDAGYTFDQLVEKTLSFRPAKKCEAWGIYAPPKFDGGFPPPFNPGGPGGPYILPFFPEDPGMGGGFGPGGPGGFGGFDTGMMKKMQQKMMEMQSGSGFSGGFGGGFGGSFQNSVLTAQRGPGGPGFGPPGFGPKEPPPADCQPPVQRLLSPDSLLMELGVIMREFEKHFESGDKCEMFQIGLDRYEQESGSSFGPPPEVGELLDMGIAACEDEDFDLVEKIAGRLFQMMRGGFGGDIFETDKLLENKMTEKLRKKFGLTDDLDLTSADESTQDYIASLEARIEELTKNFKKISEKLEEATQALMAVNEKLAALGSSTITFDTVDLSDVLDNTARLTNESRRDAVADRTNEAVEKFETIRELVSEDNQEIVDQVVASLFRSPPSEDGAEQIAKLAALAANNCSAADQEDCDAAVVDELLPTVLALNTDVSEKVADGSIPSVDITDNSKWFAPWAANAVDETLAAAGSDGKLNPEKLAAKQEVAVRACRLADIDFLEVTKPEDAVATQATGVSSWASGCIGELEKRGVNFDELGPLNEPANRATTAHILHEVLGDEPEFKVDTADVELQSDAVGHKYEEDMRWAKAIGAMGAGDEFDPEGLANRSQDFVIAVNLNEIKEAAIE